MAKRVRKAIVAGFGGGLSAVGASFVFTGAPTRDQVTKMVGTFIVGFGVTALATWKVKNAPALTK